MHKPGSIIKIAVTNFVTYDFVEMYPGQNLNMVIGPNGTGKSTIVAAIILGLGGNPKTVGRGTKISEYVKHNCEEAQIELVLHGREPNESFKITRKFSKQDRNIWTLNNQKKTLHEIIEHITQYNIQVDNLCQFLPQDKVADFAKMNKQELLKQTQTALCRTDLIELQSTLINHKERTQNLVSSMKDLEKKLKDNIDANIRLEGRVKNFKKRNKLLDVINHIMRKINWLHYYETLNKTGIEKKRKNSAENKLKVIKDAIKPMENKVNDIRRGINVLEQKFNENANEIKTMSAKIRNKNTSLAAFGDALQSYILERNEEIKKQEEHENELKILEMKVASLTDDKNRLISKMGEENELDSRLKNLNADIQNFSRNMMMLREKMSSLQNQRQDRLYNQEGLKNQLSRTENVKQQRLQLLQRRDKDAYEATMWLRDNRHLFSGTIYDPMMLEINVTNPKNALYVENSLPYKDKVAFTCTRKEDMNLLLRYLRVEKKLKVNVLLAEDTGRPDTFKPRFKIEELRKHGFTAYLTTLFTAPKPIKDYLCRMYMFHNVPVGNKTANTNLDKIGTELKRFFLNNTLYSITISKYSQAKSTRQSEIRSDGTCSLSVDQTKITEISAQLHDMQKECSRIDDEIRHVQQEIADADVYVSKIRGNIQELKSLKDQVSHSNERISKVRSKMTELKRIQRMPQEICAEYDAKMQEMKSKALEEMVLVQKAYKHYLEKQKSSNMQSLRINTQRRLITRLENESYDLREKVKVAQEEFNQANEAFEKINCELQECLREARKLSDGASPDDVSFNKFREVYDKLPNDLEELNNEKESISSRVECLMNAANEAELVEYEERQQGIIEMENTIKEQNRELQMVSSNIDELERRWVEPLLEVIGEINSKFSEFFERMGCAGEVSLCKGDNVKNFQQYGLSIKVTYRDGEPLQELNSNIQSGGERAVATATYMLSLQQLTPVPFRCVDEINQGMDANNERRIFQCLVEATSHKGTAQYFLITPKLVPKLKFCDSMRIHFVHNGPFLGSKKDWKETSRKFLECHRD